MKRQKYRRIFALVTGMLLACAFCLTAAAEGKTDYVPPSEEPIRHHLWGFFSAWAEGDTDRMLNLCSDQWKAGKPDPEQALQVILETGLPHGYKVNSISGKYGDEYRTVYVTLQRETEDGGYAYTRHGILYRQEDDGNFYLNPDNIAEGSPGEPVPEEEMVLLTQEGLIRSNLDFHAQGGLYDKLIPINAVIEKQGIRAEILSGLVEGESAWFMISLQDTEGKYSKYNLDPSFAENIDNSYSHWWTNVWHDGKENRDIFLVCQELEQPVKAEDRTVEVGVEDIRIKEEEIVDLIPLMKQNGKETEGVRPPKLEDGSYPDAPAVPDDLKILDYRQPLDVHLFGNVYLTGIGWIGDQLHVQFHNKGRDFIEMKNGRATASLVWVDGSVYDKAYEKTFTDYSPLVWDGDHDGWTEWTEYVINCRQDEAYKLELSAVINVTKTILEDGWIAQIPLNRICASSDQDKPEIPEEKAEDSAPAEETDIEIDGIHFPDAVLREQVKRYDADRNGKLSVKEAESAVEIDVRGKGVKTLKGIEHLIGLECLECSGNELAELDVSRNARLTILDCGHNLLTTLDVSRNSELRDLSCVFNHISSLDVSKNRELTDLSVSGNFLTELDVSHNPGLKWLVCPWNHLTKLDVGHNPELTNLSCGGNWLTELDLSNNPLLETVYCSDNNLTSLDISHCPKIVALVGGSTPNEVTAELEWISGTGNDTVYLYTDNSVQLYTQPPEETEGRTPEKEDSGAEDTAEVYNRYGLIDDNLKNFFFGWAQGNAQDMRYCLVSEQRDGGQETTALIKALLAGGTPLEYRINSVTGTGDGERKYDCTLLIDPENGEEPGYQRYEITLKSEEWLYSVDLRSLTCLGAAEKDPAAETVSLSGEAIINEMLDLYEPDIRKQLRPIGLSCEKDGILVEVISGLMKKNEAWILYSIQDLEGKYDDYPFTAYCANDDIGTMYGYQDYPLYRDRKEHKVYLIWNPEYEEPVQTGERTVMFGLRGLDYSQNARIDLIPLLKQYGAAAQGVPAPANLLNDNFETPANLKELKILDYSRSLDIPLLSNASVTGIGWVDGLLHLQIHMKENTSSGFSFIQTYDGTRYYGWERQAPGSPYFWFRDDRAGSEYREFVFEYQPEDIDKLDMILNADVGSLLTEGEWYIRFPLSMICPE